MFISLPSPPPTSQRNSDRVVAAQTIAGHASDSASDDLTVSLFAASGGATSLALGLRGAREMIQDFNFQRKLRKRTVARRKNRVALNRSNDKTVEDIPDWAVWKWLAPPKVAELKQQQCVGTSISSQNSTDEDGEPVTDLIVMECTKGHVHLAPVCRHHAELLAGPHDVQPCDMCLAMNGVTSPVKRVSFEPWSSSNWTLRRLSNYWDSVEKMWLEVSKGPVTPYKGRHETVDD